MIIVNCFRNMIGKFLLELQVYSVILGCWKLWVRLQPGRRARSKRDMKIRAQVSCEVSIRSSLPKDYLDPRIPRKPAFKT